VENGVAYSWNYILNDIAKQFNIVLNLFQRFNMAELPENINYTDAQAIRQYYESFSKESKMFDYWPIEKFSVQSSLQKYSTFLPMEYSLYKGRQGKIRYALVLLIIATVIIVAAANWLNLDLAGNRSSIQILILLPRIAALFLVFRGVKILSEGLKIKSIASFKKKGIHYGKKIIPWTSVVQGILKSPKIDGQGVPELHIHLRHSGKPKIIRLSSVDSSLDEIGVMFNRYLSKYGTKNKS